MTTSNENMYAEAVKDTLAEIGRRLDVDEPTAERLWRAMGKVYDLMGERGLCNAFGGRESMNVVPMALEFIRRSANAGPDDERAMRLVDGELVG